MAKMTHRYLVVQLKPLQKNKALRYTCVPDNWIVHESQNKLEVTVVYPEEVPTLTCARIQNREQPQEEWKTYEAEVKFSSDSLTNARNYMDILNNFFEVSVRQHAERSNGYEYSCHWKKRKLCPQSSLELGNCIQDYQHYCESSENSESLKNVTIQHMRPNPAIIVNSNDKETRIKVEPIQAPCEASQTQEGRILKRKIEKLLPTSENSYCLERPLSFEASKLCPQSSLELGNCIQDYQQYGESSGTSESLKNVTIQHMRPNPAIIVNSNDKDTRIKVEPIQAPCEASQTQEGRILKRNIEKLLPTSENSYCLERPLSFEARKLCPQSSLELGNCIQDYQQYGESSGTSESLKNVTIQHMRPNPAIIVNSNDKDTRIEVEPIQAPCEASQTQEGRILKRKIEKLLLTSENSYCLERPLSFEARKRQVKSVEFTELFAEMQAKLEDDVLLINRLRMIHIERTDNFNKLDDAINEHTELKHTIPDTFTSIELSSPVLTSSTKEEYADEERGDDSESNEEKKDNQVLKNKHNSSSSKFTLPPEYNPKNSNWTLRYRVYTPSLVELIKSGCVYVNKLSLSNIQRTSKDCKSLARNLMLEIFSDNALKICSFTGAGSKSVYSAEVRPGLDERARTMMLLYVENYRKKMAWCNN